MDVFFSALTLALIALVLLGLAAIEVGRDSRPGFGGVPDER